MKEGHRYGMLETPQNAKANHPNARAGLYMCEAIETNKRTVANYIRNGLPQVKKYAMATALQKFFFLEKYDKSGNF